MLQLNPIDSYWFFFVDSTKQKSIANQLDLIGAFLQEKFKNVAFVKLDSRYMDYFPEYSNYLGRDLILLKSMYGMTISGKLYSYELI